MPLPTSRNKNYTTGMPLDSQVINDLQDGIVEHDSALGEHDTTLAEHSDAIAGNKHGELMRHIPPIPHPGRLNCQFTIDGWLECTTMVETR